MIAIIPSLFLAKNLDDFPKRTTSFSTLSAKQLIAAPFFFALSCSFCRRR